MVQVPFDYERKRERSDKAAAGYMPRAVFGRQLVAVRF